MADFSKVKQNLERAGYAVSCFPTAAEAAAYLNGQIDGVTVGIGGSLTVEQLGLYDALGAHNTVWWHWRVPEGMTPNEVRDRAALCDVYLSSVNALAETGELINIDGTGNRLAATLYGHKKVYLIVGENKLAESYDAALFRARKLAPRIGMQDSAASEQCPVQIKKHAFVLFIMLITLMHGILLYISPAIITEKLWHYLLRRYIIIRVFSYKAYCELSMMIQRGV